MFQENSIKTCILSKVKQITSPGWMHETSAQAWCTGKTQRNQWRGRWEGGSGWGIHVTPWLIHVNVWQTPLQYCKVISLQLIKINGGKKRKEFSSVQFSSVTQSCPTLCDPMNGSTPGLHVHHQFPELTQTHVHRVGDAIQPSHPLQSPSPLAPNPSQHQGLFQWKELPNAK